MHQKIKVKNAILQDKMYVFKKDISDSALFESRFRRIIDQKIFLKDKKVSLSILQKSQLVNKKYKKLKLLGSGELKEKFDAEVNFISNSAKDKIEKLGGKVSLIK